MGEDPAGMGIGVQLGLGAKLSKSLHKLHGSASSGQSGMVVVARDSPVSSGSESARSNAFVIGNNGRRSCGCGDWGRTRSRSQTIEIAA